MFIGSRSAAGAMREIELDASKPDHSVQVHMRGDVVPTALTVDLEGSINGGAQFAVLASHTLSAAEITAEGALFHIVNKAVDRVRVNVSTLTGGTNPAVDIWYVNHG